MVIEVESEHIWQLLEEVKDPEIPVVSIVELGMIRNVGFADDKVYVTITPTFIGCPALDVIQQDITQKLQESGIDKLEVKVSLSQPWTSDWITEEGRNKLKEFGLSPPPRHGGELEMAITEIAPCPYCDSDKTVLKNSFGPTLCRAIYFCNNCHQPFEQFKQI
jgi:ring-1,2-phenylacetyl-CoA epoxidase subunit PaaD